MAKFHINPDTGKAGTCTAYARPCLYGENTPHYASVADAQTAYEEMMSDNTLSTHSRGGGTLTLVRPSLASVRIEAIQTTVDKVYEYSGRLAKIATRANDVRRVDFNLISKAIDAVIADSNLATVDSGEKTIDRLEDLKNELNRKGHDLDASGERTAASLYWEASESLADLIVENGPSSE
jgi:hypothetical protein